MTIIKGGELAVGSSNTLHTAARGCYSFVWPIFNKVGVHAAESAASALGISYLGTLTPYLAPKFSTT